MSMHAAASGRVTQVMIGVMREPQALAERVCLRTRAQRSWFATAITLAYRYGTNNSHSSVRYYAVCIKG